MKTQRQSTCLALQLDVEEATGWWLLGFQFEDSDNLAQPSRPAWCLADFANQ